MAQHCPIVCHHAFDSKHGKHEELKKKKMDLCTGNFKTLTQNCM